MNVKDTIADLRGGYSSQCDWCNKETLPEDLEPEEAGQWVCHVCIDLWEKENNAHWATGQPKNQKTL